MGIKVIPFGFETESVEYNPESPKEKGKPDYVIELNSVIYFEVTGTNVEWVTDEKNLWVRPDKVEYVENHNINGYVCHILNNRYNKIRFIDANNIPDKNRIIYRYITKNGIRSREKFIEIYPYESISLNEMRNILGV